MNDRLYRTLSIDYGSVRIGLAISDLMGIIAGPLETYTRTSSIDVDIRHIVDIIDTKNVRDIVVGLPLNMDGTEGETARQVREFVAALQRVRDIEVHYIDERLSSVSAEEMLISADVSRSKRKKVIDKVAATIILQNYLDSNKRS